MFVNNTGICKFRGSAGLSKSKRKFECNAPFLFCKDGAICAKNSPKRTSYGVARTIVKGTSLRSPSPIMAPGYNNSDNLCIRFGT